MDPEDLREVISAYQKCVAETVRRFGGFVAKYMGDGVLVYFGYPQAHEDDAERAVRAGLELIGHRGNVLEPLRLAEGAHKASALHPGAPQQTPFGQDDGPGEDAEGEQNQEYELGHRSGVGKHVQHLAANHDCRQREKMHRIQGITLIDYR